MPVKKSKAKTKNKNPNIRTRAFGAPMWHALIFTALGYPERTPSFKKQRDYKRFFTLVGDTIPCNLCRDSYKLFLKKLPLNKKVMSTRKNLTFWVFKIKNMVNKKLGCKVLNYSELLKKYKYFNKFRATSCSPKLLGCTKAAKGVKQPLRCKVVTVKDHKAKSYYPDKRSKKK